MSEATRQPMGIILPTAYVLGTELETVNDLVEHTSIEFQVEELRDKMVHVVATEVIAAGVPGNLNLWVELSPVPTTTSGTYWGAIGGGGNALAPVAPVVEAATGAALTTHAIMLTWAIHSVYARVVVQTPVAPAPATAYWTVQAVLTGKG